MAGTPKAGQNNQNGTRLKYVCDSDKESPVIEPRRLVELLEGLNENEQEGKQQQQLFILDATWLGLPDFQERDPKIEFDKIRIPFAHFFDLDECCDKESKLPHMMPNPLHFSSFLANVCTTCAKHDTSGEFDGGTAVEKVDMDRDVFVVYDTVGMWSAPRVWLMLKAFGATQVFILNGGLSAWMQQGYPVDTSPPSSQPPGASADKIEVVGVKLDSRVIKSLSDIKQFVQSQAKENPSLLIDSRSAKRFTGEDEEPRNGIPSGNIPGSLNIPWSSVLETHIIKRDRNTLSGQMQSQKEEQIDYQYFTYMALDALKSALVEKLRLATTHDRELIFTCGSGVSAVIVLVAAIISGIGDWHSVSLYDGSWTEWKLDEMGGLQE